MYFKGHISDLLLTLPAVAQLHSLYKAAFCDAGRTRVAVSFGVLASIAATIAMTM